MNASPEYASFARLVESLRPWLDQVVVVGGWAHRLYRLHPLAQQLRYQPLATLDADIALPTRLKVTGDEIYQRLASNGFEAEFVGRHKPPAAHYRLTDAGIEFYAEFVAPLAGSAVTRRGRSKATQSVGGISSQNLRYVEVLLGPGALLFLRATASHSQTTHGCRSQIPSVFPSRRYSFTADGVAISARKTLSTCMTQSTPSPRGSLSCGQNGPRISSTSCTRRVFAPCNDSLHRQRATVMA